MTSVWHPIVDQTSGVQISGDPDPAVAFRNMGGKKVRCAKTRCLTIAISMVLHKVVRKSSRLKALDITVRSLEKTPNPNRSSFSLYGVLLNRHWLQDGSGWLVLDIV